MEIWTRWGHQTLEEGRRTAEFDAYRDLFEAGDVITHLNGTPTPTLAEFGKVVGRLLYARAPGGDGVDQNATAPGSFAGEWVSVGIRRGDVDSTVRIPRIHSVVQGGAGLALQSPELASGVFSTVFAHDFRLRPEECGGPVVDLAGHVVGLNIARADATRTLAIPADVVQAVIKALRSQAAQRRDGLTHIGPRTR